MTQASTPMTIAGRTLLVLTATLLSSGCTMARMEGFDAMAARPDLERVAVRDIPGWRDGGFTYGQSHGTVRRRSATEAIGFGDDRSGAMIDRVRVGVARSYGTLTFDIAGPDLDGRLAARCRFAREEARDIVGADLNGAGGVDVAIPSVPLQLECRYQIDGRNAGAMNLTAVAARGVIAPEPRIGGIVINGTELEIRSTHGIAGVAMTMPDATGYVLVASNSQVVGAIEQTGGQRRDLLLPRDRQQRTAAVAAALTMALFWDPGNTG